ncbi:hypothetical protein [Actinomadura sp. DC4]|uniref:hypothetical protein n=1 Tax=Actinomadura sp. DC4 TaxID=3055069 RepID=UPI0025B17E6E|nr:hypothetical protein [Actinomadura sp. DC4]MDN3357273.1 hypothetical protein [Actinomadura sp. DC4]
MTGPRRAGSADDGADSRPETAPAEPAWRKSRWSDTFCVQAVAYDIPRNWTRGTRRPQGRNRRPARNATRTDLIRARKTLAMRPVPRVQEFMDTATEIVIAAGEKADVDDARTLVAAEIARSGREAGVALARRLTGDDQKPDEKKPDGEKDITPETRSGQDTVSYEELLDGMRLGMADGRPVALWLPGAPEHGPRFDEDTIAVLGERVPPETVLVIGTEHDGQVMVHGRPVSKETLEDAVAARAPGVRPLLLHQSGITVDLPASVEAHDTSMSADPPVASTSEALLAEVDAPRPRRPSSRVSVRTDVSRPSTVLGQHGDPVEGTASPPPPANAPVTEDLPLDEMARSIGVPRAGLPYMRPLLDSLAAELRRRQVVFTEKNKSELVQRLLSNYPYLLSGRTDDDASGLVVPIGSAEVLITFNPKNPRRVRRNPAGSYSTPSKNAAPKGVFKAIGSMNAAYGTGAHVETHSGQTSATRGKVALTFGVGATPNVLNVVKISASVSGVANQSNRSTSNIKDAERGKVEDNRVDAELITYGQVNISYKIRQQKKSEALPRWQRLRPTRIRESGKESLLVWIPKPYTKKAPEQTVTATGEAVEERQTRLPRNYFASGLTNVPRLFDEILTALNVQGLRLPTGSVTRQELLQKLTNLNAHLDDAVNEQRGYQITLHDARGEKIAKVRVRSRRLFTEQAPQVGATSDKSHLEDVRTAIDGSSGSHTLTNSSTVMPVATEFDLLPDPTGAKKAGLNAGAAVSYTKTRTDTLSAGRTGLLVSVPRFTGLTAAYDVQFRHQASVSVRGGRRGVTGPVPGHGLVRMPVKEAFAHGFAVDRKALVRAKRPSGETMPYRSDAVKGSGRRPEDPQEMDVPLHVKEGKGIGMGLVRVADGTVDALREQIEQEVNRYGFLSPDQNDPFASHHWYSHGNRLRRRLSNQELLDKMISTQGLDSHYDQIHQDGMTFTLRVSSGTLGMDLDVDSVKVTVRARKSETTEPRYLRTTDEYHTVNLAMGMDTAGQGVGHSRKLAFGVSIRALFDRLKGAATSLEAQRTVGAADNVSFLNNRPELLEFPGPVDEFELTSDYEVSFEYKNSARVRPDVQPPERTQNKLRKPPHTQRTRRVPLPGQTAVAHLLRLGTADQRTPGPAGTAPRDLLDQGLVYFIDTTGLRERAGRALTDLTGPTLPADSDIDTFAGTIGVRAHLREILNGEYTTDRLFDTGLLRDTFGAVNISGDLQNLEFSGSTGEKFVKGDIKLFLAENRLTDSDSLGLTWDQLDVAAGGDVGHAGMVGEADVNRHWQWNTSKSDGHSGGKELIQLDFNHAYAFSGKMHFTVSAQQEKRSKVVPSGKPRRLQENRLDPRTVMFLLSEPEALKRYGDGTVPISDRQLADALKRWQDEKLTLTGDTVAKVLTRWKAHLSVEAAALEELEGLAIWDSDVPRLLEQADAFADTLTQRQPVSEAPVRNAQVRQDFNNAFGRPVPLEAPRAPFETVDLSKSGDLLDYAKGAADLTDARLREAMESWRNGDLALSGETVAKILMRWMVEVPASSDVEDDRNAFVQLLYGLHANGGSPIWHEKTREAFEDLLTPEQRPMRDPKTPIEHMELPEYLRRDDPGGRILGHSGMQSYRHTDGRTTYQLVRDKVEAMAPGMLAKGAEVWDRSGRVIGRMQGGVDALQAMLAEGRDVGMFEEFLSANGYSFYLVNPVGWLLTDVVEINVSSVLKSAPKISEFVPQTGIEVYGHGYNSISTSKSKDGSQALTPAKLGTGGQESTTASDAVAVKVSEGHHRGTTRAETGVTEQTVYDWSGHYLAGFDEEMTISVRRLKMNGRPLNKLLLKMFDGATHHGRAEPPGRFPGRLEIQVPRAIAEAGVLRGPSALPDLAKLPKLPGNAFISGALLDDALPIAQKLLAGVFEPGAVAKLFGAKAGDPAAESSRSLPVLLSRLHLTNHLQEATDERGYQVAKGLIMPGDADTRADLYLKGGLYDLEVIAQMKDGTGTGRYAKHQSGTTTSSSTDQVRVEGDYQIDGSGEMGKHHPDQHAHTWDGQNSGSRITSMKQESADTKNYRREQHVKEQGPVYMVRLRFGGRLHADKFEHHLFRAPTPKGRQYSDPISGDVYAELFQAEVDELRAQMERTKAAWQERPGEAARRHRESWPHMQGAPTFDLAPLLTGAAGKRLEAIRAYQEVARQIRNRIGGDRPVVLTSDAATLAREAYRAVRPWAETTMQADLAAALEAGVPVEVLPDVPAILQNHTIDPDERTIATSAMNRAVNELIDAVQATRDQVNAALAGLPAARLAILPELPLEVSLLGLDPVYVARDVAHALHTHVLVESREGNVVGRRTWIDPEGGMHTFDPAHNRIIGGRLSVLDGLVWDWFTADLAHRRGLLSDLHHAEVLDFGLDDAEVGRLYFHAIARRQTFEQAVAGEIAARRARVETLLKELSDRRRADLAAFVPEDHELDRLYRRAAARGQTFKQAAAEEIAARRARLDTLRPGMSRWVRRAYDARRFWYDDLDWRRAEDTITRQEIDSLDMMIAQLRERLAAPSAQDDPRARARIQDSLEGQLLYRETRAGWLADVTPTPAAEARVDEAHRILGHLRTLARGDAPGPPSQAAITQLGEWLDDLTALGRMGRAPRVRFLYAAVTGTTGETIERGLRQAQSGDVSLVAVPDRPELLVAVNRDGAVRWFDAGSRRPAGRPGTVDASLDLDRDGVPSDLADELPRQALDQAFFQRLRSSAAALARPPRPPVVPEGLAITDAVLSVEENGRPVLHHRDEGGPHAEPLADYAPVFWLTHDAPDEGVTVEDIVADDWTDALDFLTADRDASLPQRFHRTLVRRSDRLVETRNDLPDDLPPGTWVAFHGAATGAAVALPDGAYRTYVPGDQVRILPAEDLRRRAGERSVFVVAEPDDMLPLLLLTPPSRPESPYEPGPGWQHDTEPEPPRDRDAGHGPTVTDHPPPEDPHLYRNATGGHRVGERGLAQDGWRHVGALSEFAPVSWLTHGAPPAGMTPTDVMETDLPAAVRFFARAEQVMTRADAVRDHLAGQPGRSVEVTRTRPENLPPKTWVWFTGPGGDGAVHVGDGVVRRFVPLGTTLRARAGDPLLFRDAHTFVVARPAVAHDVTRPVTPVRDAEPRTGPAPDDRAVFAPPWEETDPRTGEESERLPSAYRGATERTADALRALEARLLAAGSRALALVTTQEPERRLVAYNRHGRIRWSEYPSGQAATPPEDARAAAYVTLDDDGTLLDPPAGAGAPAFPRLYAAAVASLRGPRTASATPRRPADVRPRPDRPSAFLGEPRARLGPDGPAALPRVPETDERPVWRTNVETDDSGFAWWKSPYSGEDCVEVSVVWS